MVTQVHPLYFLIIFIIFILFDLFFVRGGVSVVHQFSVFIFEFCLSSLCILSLLLSVSLVLFFCTLYLEPTIVSVPCFVCLHTVS